MSSQQHRAGRFLSFFTHERALMFRWIGLGSYQASDSLGGGLLDLRLLQALRFFSFVSMGMETMAFDTPYYISLARKPK